MITIFTTPKDFLGIYKIIQTNALKSWEALSPKIQIIIFGKSKGASEIALEIGADYVPNVKCSKLGTPFISDMFRQADKLAKYSNLVFINCDIILPKNFLISIDIVSKHFKFFLLVGHRWDIDINTLINFNDKSDCEVFNKKVQSESKQHLCTGIDYFVFKKGQWKNFPDLLIGRDGWDNWIIWKARRIFLPVVDGTSMIKAIHQNHSYHKNKIIKDEKITLKYEREHNRKIYFSKIFYGKPVLQSLNLLDCTYAIVNNKVLKRKNKEFKIRNLYRLPTIYPELSILIKFYRKLYRFFSY